MKKVFKSKVGIVIVAATILAIGLPLWTLPLTLINLVVIGVLGGILLPILFGTYYAIQDDILFIRCGLLFWHIDIGTIVSIKETRSILSSPALSFDRLEIKYENGRSRIMVSPKLKRDFIDALISVNKTISVLL